MEDLIERSLTGMKRFPSSSRSEFCWLKEPIWCILTGIINYHWHPLPTTHFLLTIPSPFPRLAWFGVITVILNLWQLLPTGYPVTRTAAQGAKHLKQLHYPKDACKLINLISKSDPDCGKIGSINQSVSSWCRWPRSSIDLIRLSCLPFWILF